MKQKIRQVNAGENEQRIEIYKCIQNQRLTEIRSSHFPIFLVKWDLQWSSKFFLLDAIFFEH